MYKHPIVYRGINAAKVFMEVAIKEAEEIEYLYSYKKSMIPLTKEQQDVYDSSSHCYICSGSFTKEDWKRRVYGVGSLNALIVMPEQIISFSQTLNLVNRKTFLLYLDANNLYGWAMSQYLPLNDFKWVDFLDVDNIDENGGKGYILEVDLEYPESLHDDHSDLPLAPESSVPPGCKEKRLLTTLYPKTNYVVHIRNLKQYLKLGLVLKKVHKILEFHQESWLQPYINMNTQFRTEAENEFEKNFYKLMNNAIFGKTMENIRKRVDIRLCNNGEKAEKLISKPNFKDRTIFCENLAAFHMGKTSLTLNKPIAVGMSILDISKTLMYEFHYHKMKACYGENVKLLYTDTDSFIYNIKCDDIYSDIKKKYKSL
ncbi:uncharacterized protein TNCV_4632411 [Trichonephila clavipes]|nr:uncharacterized protein TNCV_4632411 [Trichonephila clavipes]